MLSIYSDNTEDADNAKDADNADDGDDGDDADDADVHSNTGATLKEAILSFILLL
jgi:hypothetical protein